MSVACCTGAPLLGGKSLIECRRARFLGGSSFPGGSSVVRERLGNLVRLWVRKSDSGDAEPSVVGKRKDGRFYLEAGFEFDEEEDDSPTAVKGSKKTAAAQGSRKVAKETQKAPAKSEIKRPKRDRTDSEPLNLRREVDIDSDDDDDHDSEYTSMPRKKPVRSDEKRTSKLPTRPETRSKMKSTEVSRVTMSDRRRSYDERGDPRLREKAGFDSDDDLESEDTRMLRKRPVRSDEKTTSKLPSRPETWTKMKSSDADNSATIGDRRRERSYDELEDPRLARRREKKEPPRREQVYLPYLMKKSPHVAILGGGMSGLVCALTLEERGIRSTVFDTGKHGLGGRMGTRDIIQQDGKRLIFDHAAQYFTVKDHKFQKLVDQWMSEGAVKEWDGVVGMLREGQFTELPSSVKYVATHGMRHLADHLVSKARLIHVQRPCWISSIEPVGGTWKLTENGLDQGQYDAVVIAHNGKCANRLLGPSGAPLVARQMKSLELSSIWALLAAFDEPLPQPTSMPSGATLDGAFVEGVSSLSWMGNNTKKLGLGASSPQCWTFFSTAAYGRKHKVPQESIPVVKAERVKREVLQGVEMAMGVPEGTLPVPFYTRVQLWGAALPTNTPGVSCIFDPHSRVGMCGDWLLGASLEAAALSGMDLAHHMADFCEKAREGYFEEEPEEVEKFSIGLETPLSGLESHDIGEFPGSTTPEQQKITGRALKVGALVS